ncbi:MAG: M1 family metallopeptidase [Lewinellaceae bacterium]|nr:M1 family metallopeptidase [Lewinellaceae bacterium]
MKKYSLFPVLLAGILLLSCNASRKVSSTIPDEVRVLDTMVVTAPAFKETDPKTDIPNELPEYQASATRLFDLLHTELHVSFDWEKEAVNGEATLTLLPYFYPADQLTLDAKDFDVHSLKLENGRDLSFQNDGEQLTIQLDRSYERTDTLEVRIDYTAYPKAEGGSWAITSDKGLFFINPRGEDPEKPRQIWTQGETENNSRWFPTIDKPNERCTDDIYITVEGHFKTLSNGVLVSSANNPDGTRTDHWRMDQPHAPYLMMLAVGDYAVVPDTWRNIPLQYYVEPEFEADAKAIFPYTPEMLEFFSNLLDYPYPWPKFSQIVVRDYVSGAMENTTAVVFGEFMNGKTRELVDVLDNETIVAHEMFHQWFGDLVTCESWANITLNEGFANYAEYLWLEHKHGKEDADYHLISETDGYVSAAHGNAHPLIDYHYSDRESMFDEHSYNKGGLVLHMLRNYLGDEAFFAGLHHYLIKNAYSDVEADELREAMEEVSGQDLNWFFDQWYFQKGHPILDIQYDYDEKSHEVVVRVEQTQYQDGMPPIFQFPVTVQIFLPGQAPLEEKDWMRERVKEFRFKVPGKPQLVLFDPDRVLLCERSENKSTEDYLNQYHLASNVRDRLEALQNLVGAKSGHPTEVLISALDDSFWGIRMFAMDNLETGEIPLPKVEAIAKGDPHSHVRAAACFFLGQSGDGRYADTLEKIVENDYSLITTAAALNALYTLSPEKGLKMAQSLENQESDFILNVVADIYFEAKDISKLDFFQKRVEKTEQYTAVYFIMNYLELVQQGDLSNLLEASELFSKTATNSSASIMKRYAAMRALNELHVHLHDRIKQTKDDREKEAYAAADKTILDKIEAIKAAESNPELKDIFESFPNLKK